MHGFLLTYATPDKRPSIEQTANDNNLLTRYHEAGKLSVRQTTLRKFLADKVWHDDAQCFAAIEGVILNKHELLRDGESLAQWMTRAYKQKGETFFCALRGSFCGVFYDKNNDTLLIFNDHVGSKMLFWRHSTDGLCAGSSLNDVASLCRCGSLDELGMYDLLTYGFSPTHHTIYNGIHRLAAGKYLRVSGNECQELVYHRFSNTHRNASEQDHINELDRLFRQAVKRILDKNSEESLRNFFPLSGGLDSRMVNVVARQLTNAPICNFTYSQTGYYEAEYPQQISAWLGNGWHFRALDGGDYLKRLDDTVAMTDKQINYAGAAQMLDTMLDTDFSPVGVVATGIGGDDIMNSPIDKPRSNYRFYECALGSGRYLRHLSLVPQGFNAWYANRNIYYLYTRTFECHALGSPLMLQNATESCSPFMDVDFLEYVLSIPEQMRQQYRLYDKWVLTKYPETARWPHNWHTIGHRPLECHIFHRHIPVRDLPKRVFWYICRHLHIHNFYTIKRGQSMNPIDTWLAENKSLREFFDAYYAQHISLLNGHKDIKKAAAEIYGSGEWQNQALVLTLLSAVSSTGLIAAH